MNTAAIVDAPPARATHDSSVPQYVLRLIILMFLWPAIWFALMMYGFGPFFLTAEGTVRTWLHHLVWAARIPQRGSVRCIARIMPGAGPPCSPGLSILARQLQVAHRVDAANLAEVPVLRLRIAVGHPH